MRLIINLKKQEAAQWNSKSNSNLNPNFNSNPNWNPNSMFRDSLTKTDVYNNDNNDKCDAICQITGTESTLSCAQSQWGAYNLSVHSQDHL